MKVLVSQLKLAALELQCSAYFINLFIRLISCIMYLYICNNVAHIIYKCEFNYLVNDMVVV